MDAVKFLKELERMCDSFGEGYCGGCEIYKLREKAVGRYTPSCDNIVKKLPEECVTIVEKWYAEHPAKTRLMDLLEKFPKFSMGANNSPMVLPRLFGYCGRGRCQGCEHQNEEESCWNLPLEE